MSILMDHSNTAEVVLVYMLMMIEEDVLVSVALFLIKRQITLRNSLLSLKLWISVKLI